LTPRSSCVVVVQTCHQNIFSACNELTDFTIPRINRVIRSCIGIAGLCYVLIATMGYHTYGSAIQSNILRNYPDNYVLAVARILIATNCAFTYPLQCNPCRMSLSLLMHQWSHRSTVGQIDVHLPSELRLTILTAGICILSLGVAMVVDDLGVILSIVGATGSTTISYILPGLIFLKLHPIWTPKHYAAAALFLIGCIVIPSCLTFIFI
jgi:amino acid permease